MPGEHAPFDVDEPQMSPARARSASSKISQLVVEWEFCVGLRAMSAGQKREMIEPHPPISMALGVVGET